MSESEIRKKAIDEVVVINGLERRSTTQERVRALLEAGIPAYAIAETTGASISTLRNWSSGVAEPRREAAEGIDSIRNLMRILHLGGLSIEQARQLIMSQSEEPPFNRLIDDLKEDPKTVLTAASEQFPPKINPET
jgi:hypothetical protein